MRSSPILAAGGVCRPSDAVITRAEAESASVPMRRVAPASAMSALFHVLLLALFIWLAPRGHGASDVAREAGRAVDVEDDTPPEPRNNSEVAGSRTEGDDIVPTNPEGRLSDHVDFGGRDISGDPGSLVGNNQSAVTGPLPPLGFGERFGGQRPTLEGVEGNWTATGKNPSGGVAWGSNSGRIGAAALTTDQALKIGVTTASLASVNKGLKWLARVQSPNGSWKLDGNFPDPGTRNDVAGTALGLLPFLADGKTHTSSKGNPYDKPIERALQFLIDSQDRRTGAFSRDMYAHGLATIAISEAFALSKDYRLKKPAQQAINFIVSAQHTGGGWRYSPGQAGDLSVSGWQIMALKSGLMAGLDVPAPTLRRAQAFLDEVVDPRTEGSGYTGPQPTPTMTAVSLLCRQYLSGWGRQNARLIKGIDNHLKPNSPRPEKRDVYYYYYATQVMHNFGGDDWKAWNAQLREQLIASQSNDEKDAATYGSWSPAGDQWGRSGGRLMMTSMNLLTLEVYYRYLPLYYREK